jgi:hypothetical protein
VLLSAKKNDPFCKIKRFKRKKTLRLQLFEPIKLEEGFLFFIFSLFFNLKKKKNIPKNYTLKKVPIFQIIIPFFDPRK